MKEINLYNAGQQVTPQVQPHSVVGLVPQSVNFINKWQREITEYDAIQQKLHKAEFDSENAVVVRISSQEEFDNLTIPADATNVMVVFDTGIYYYSNQFVLNFALQKNVWICGNGSTFIPKGKFYSICDGNVQDFIGEFASLRAMVSADGEAISCYDKDIKINAEHLEGDNYRAKIDGVIDNPSPSFAGVKIAHNFNVFFGKIYKIEEGYIHFNLKSSVFGEHFSVTGQLVNVDTGLYPVIDNGKIKLNGQSAYVCDGYSFVRINGGISNCIISNCKFIGSNAGRDNDYVLISSAVDNVSIEIKNCSFSHLLSKGVRVEGAGSTILFINNDISECNKTIVNTTSATAQVICNKFDRMSILLGGSELNFNGGFPTYSCISINGSKHIVKDNIFTNCYNSAISVGNTNEWSIIDGNLIINDIAFYERYSYGLQYDNCIGGIYFYGKNVIVRDNVLIGRWHTTSSKPLYLGSPINAIYGDNGVYDSKIYRNLVINNDKGGFDCRLWSLNPSNNQFVADKSSTGNLVSLNLFTGSYMHESRARTLGKSSQNGCNLLTAYSGETYVNGVTDTHEDYKLGGVETLGTFITMPLGYKSLIKAVGFKTLVTGHIVYTGEGGGVMAADGMG